MRRGKPPVPMQDRFWKHVDKTPTCWYWVGSKTRTGYGVVTTCGKPQLAHRAAWELTNGPIPDGAFVCHACDTPPCVRPDHLWIGDHKQNMLDRDTKGRLVYNRDIMVRYGEKSNAAKLTRAAVDEILAANPTKRADKEAFAARFGVRPKTIEKIARGRSWAQTGPEDTPSRL